MTQIRKWWDAHPNLFSWALLAVGMVIIVIIAARDVGFKPGQWAAILAATVALAGLCVWIISWEDADADGDDTPDDGIASAPSSTADNANIPGQQDAPPAEARLSQLPNTTQDPTTVERK